MGYEIKILGIFLIILGVCMIVAAIPPPYGFSRLPDFLNEYEKAVAEKREPTLDQKGAHSDYMFMKYGAFSIVLGGAIWFVGFLSERI